MVGADDTVGTLEGITVVGADDTVGTLEGFTVGDNEKAESKLGATLKDGEIVEEANGTAPDTKNCPEQVNEE